MDVEGQENGLYLVVAQKRVKDVDHRLRRLLVGTKLFSGTTTLKVQGFRLKLALCEYKTPPLSLRLVVCKVRHPKHFALC